MEIRSLAKDWDLMFKFRLAMLILPPIAGFVFLASQLPMGVFRFLIALIACVAVVLIMSSAWGLLIAKFIIKEEENHCEKAGNKKVSYAKSERF